MGKAEGEFLGADLAAEALADQQFEIGFVVDREDFGGAHHTIHFTTRAWFVVSGRARRQLPQLLL